MSDDKKQIGGISVDWELANNEARRWADSYAGQLVRGIADTTRATIRREVANFTQNQESINQLGKRLQNSAAFSPERARMIAVTEVTRSYAEGNEAAWRESGVVQGKEWITAVDELVCPICGPLHGKIVPIGQQFEGGYDNPPAHPRCRCFTVPSEIDAAPVDSFEFVEGEGFVARDLGREAEQRFMQEQLASPGFNTFANIRPPAGRAPRGLGQEYATRRRVVSKIETHMAWQGQARAQIEQYRGQASRRRQISVARDRLAQLNKAIPAMLKIAENSYGDWGFVDDLIKGIAAEVSETRAILA